VWIGLAIAITFTVKWFFMFPYHEGRWTIYTLEWL
jgi:hypothetical protein